MKEFEGYRVLLAEAEPADRERIANLVRELGAACEMVDNGEALLAKLKDPDAQGYDLVLTAVNLPGKSGIDACSEFRASDDPKAKTLPFFGISADTDHELFDHAVYAGMNSVMLKPVSFNVLYAYFTLTLKDNNASILFCDRIQQAITAAKAKSYFFSTVSHDIRTPLNAIIGFSQMLKLGFKTEEERIQALDAILVSGKTLLQLINDILDLSKLESGRMPIEPEPTNCAKLVDEIVASFRISVQKADLEIRCKAGNMPLLMLDPQRLRQIAFNLVGNAVKFTQRGFVELRVTYEPNGMDVGTFTLEVEDTGCGISEEDQLRIASPYVQLGSKMARNGGTGLGLAICRQLVAAMGGEFELQSALGRGSIFRVIIPDVRVGVRMSNPRLTATQRIAVNIPASSARNKNLRVLIADDSKMNLMVLRAMLSRLGITDIVSTMNGKEAMDALQAPEGAPFNLVLTDMWMPVMDGEALVRAIRADPNLANLPVYVITADVEARKSYSEMGFTDILLKPVTIEMLKGIRLGEAENGTDG